MKRRKNINEVFYWASYDRDSRKLKPENGSFSWVKIGEYTNYTWSNKEMRDIPRKLSIEVNENTFEELEQIKNSSISKYLRAIYNTRKNLNVMNNNLIRFIEEDGREGGLSDFKTNRTKLYDEYKNSPWYDILCGYNPDKQKHHEEFMNKLLKNGNNAVLYHYSNKKIENGYVYSAMGEANRYTPQSDQGYTYFWASKDRGRDQSGGDYIYYCEVPIEKIYDYSSNLEGFKSQSEAFDHYPYIAYYWDDDDAIVVKTLKPTPISYVKEYNTYSNKMSESRIRKIIKESILDYIYHLY